MKVTQIRAAWFAAACASVLLCSCHSKEWVAQNSVDEPALIIPLKTNPTSSRTHALTEAEPSERSKAPRSTTYSSTRAKRGRNIDSLSGQKSASRSDAKMMDANLMFKANYMIAGIGHAQNPLTVYNWNWARDFGGTVDAVTIGF